MTINVMTLGGLAIAVGSLVDDAIIGMENAFRRLRENAERFPRRSAASRRLDVIYAAIVEITPSIVFATIIIAIVFVPLFFLQGIEGRFFRPLGIAFIVSILASLVVSLTVTPAMCKLSHAPREADEARVARRPARAMAQAGLRARFGPQRRSACARSSCSAQRSHATVLAVWLGSTFGTSFLPEFNEGTFTVGAVRPAGDVAEGERPAWRRRSSAAPRDRWREAA